MKKMFLVILLVNFLALNLSYGADQWDKTVPDSADDISDYPTDCQANNEALDRALYLQRINCNVISDTSAQIKVLAGSVSIPNSAGSVVKWRRNTSSTTVTWAMLDTYPTVEEAVSTQYYVYAVADADATTFTVKISTSSSAPTSTTYYRLIGYFYNNADGDIVSVGNIGGNVGNKITVTGTTDITNTSTSYADMTDMVVYFYSNGKPVNISFSCPIASSVAGTIIYVALYVDTTLKTFKAIDNPASVTSMNMNVDWLGTLTTGIHTIKAKWKVNANTGRQYASTLGNRTLIVEE